MDYFEEGRTINGAYYADEQRWLHQEIVKKIRGKLTRAVLLLHQPTPLKLLWLLRLNTSSLPHPHVFSRFSPFYLFPNLKTNLPGMNFGSNEAS